ncbi:MAG: hypothetical protein AB8I69_02345 [Anaerolineae bacterium]|jgi:hypothetical protein
MKAVVCTEYGPPDVLQLKHAQYACMPEKGCLASKPANMAYIVASPGRASKPNFLFDFLS